MKKILTLIVCLVMVLGLTACGGNETNNVNNSTEQVQPLKKTENLVTVIKDAVIINKDHIIWGTNSRCDVFELTLENKEYRLLIEVDKYTYLQANIGDIMNGSVKPYSGRYWTINFTNSKTGKVYHGLAMVKLS